MPEYVYSASGDPVGFVRGMFIHDMSGRAVAQLQGTHVYRLSGGYVGELYHQQIVDQRRGNLGRIAAVDNPGSVGKPRHPGNRRVVITGFRDLSAQLIAYGRSLG